MKLSGRFSEALVYATELHADQRRKISGVPYVSHLLRVAGIAIGHGADEDEAIAALLHDAVEDQGGARVREEIRRRFGDRVVEIVDGCTDSDRHPKPPWRARKKAYLARLKRASPSVRLVSASDKLDNSRSVLLSYRWLGESLWEKFAGGRDGVLWYYRSVVEILKQAGANELVDELDRVVSELERTVAQASGEREKAEPEKKTAPRKKPAKVEKRAKAKRTAKKRSVAKRGKTKTKKKAAVKKSS
ncbi:MAG TPA: HD domain-containing protein [Thermoguttaceae bacterium]|nr:HD domain-containing protein [Thermoguttaceae bacterium]